jgi:hypothetical protein
MTKQAILFLYNLSSLYMGMIVVGLTVSVVFLAYALARLVARTHVYRDYHPSVFSMISIIATIQSLLVAFAAINVWNSFNDAGRTVAAEAFSANALARDLAAMDNQAADGTAIALHAYLELVIHQEWPRMQQEMEQDRDTEHSFNRVIDLANRIDPSSPRQTVLLAEILKRSNDLITYRQQRLLALDTAMPTSLWVAILGVSSLTFFLLFTLPPSAFHILLIGSWATTLGIVFFFILAVDRPFTGEISVSPQAFQNAIDNLFESRIWPTALEQSGHQNPLKGALP